MQRGEDKNFKRGHRGIESAQRQLLKDIAQAWDMYMNSQNCNEYVNNFLEN